MTKDEMKNRISMALQDPILQQGFEIICKNLSDLEKENAELKEKLNFSTQYYQGEKAKEQLTKAKVIMRIGIEGTKREFIFEGRDRPFAREAKEMLNDFIVKAEQFLRDDDIDNAIQQANKSLNLDKIAEEIEQDLKDSEESK